MSTLSVVGAVTARIETFNAIPAVYSFDAPPSVDNVQVYPAYILLADNGTSASYEFEHTVFEQTTLTITVYANTLQAVDEIVEKLKYNGGAIDAGAGLDFGALPALAVNYGDLEVRRLSEKRFAAMTTGKYAQRISVCEMQYRVSLYRYT